MNDNANDRQDREQFMYSRTVTLSAGVPKKVTMVANQIHVFDAQFDVYVTPDDGQKIRLKPGQGVPLTVNRHLFIVSDQAQQIEVRYAELPNPQFIEQTARIEGDVTVIQEVINSDSGLADVSAAPVAVTEVAAANPNRKSITLGVDANAPGFVRFGDAGTVGAAQGTKVEPGGSYTTRSRAAIECYNPNAPAVTIDRSEEA